jgi:hypothetical protein
MADPDRSTLRAGKARAGRSTPARYIWPALIGVALGTAVGGYLFWSHGRSQQAAETVADPSLDKPSPEDCAIARAALAAIHASGDDARWRASLGPLTLKARSQGVNPVDVPGYADDEADNLRGKTIADWRGCEGLGGFVRSLGCKTIADWRGCEGLGGFVRSLGWSAMSGDEGIAEVGLARPGVNAAGDQAMVYEMVGAPRQDAGGALMLARGPWLVTLHRDGVAWRVTATTDIAAKKR